MQSDRNSIPTYREYVDTYAAQCLPPEQRHRFRFWHNSIVCPVIGDKPLNEITPSDDERIQRACYESNLSLWTMRYIDCGKNDLFNYAVSNEIIPFNPCRPLILKGRSEPAYLFYDPEEHNRIIAAIESVPLCNMIALCYYTRLSLNQVRTILFHDVDLVSSPPAFRIQADLHRGAIPIPPALTPYMESEAAKRAQLGDRVNTGFFFITDEGKFITRTDLQKCIMALRKLLQDPTLKIDDLGKGRVHKGVYAHGIPSALDHDTQQEKR